MGLCGFVWVCVGYGFVWVCVGLCGLRRERGKGGGERKINGGGKESGKEKGERGFGEYEERREERDREREVIAENRRGLKRRERER